MSHRKFVRDQPPQNNGYTYLTVQETGAKFKISGRTVYRHTRLEKFPESVQVGGRTLWIEEELDDWVLAGRPRMDHWNWRNRYR